MCGKRSFGEFAHGPIGYENFGRCLRVQGRLGKVSSVCPHCPRAPGQPSAPSASSQPQKTLLSGAPGPTESVGFGL